MTRNTTATPHPIRRIAGTTALALVAPLALPPGLTIPAHAFFGGFGRIVYDPTNHAENLLTAAWMLEQINNQIASLQNEAQMLINQAYNLASLPHSSLQQNVTRTQQLLDEAQNVAFDVQQVDQAFESLYGDIALSATNQQLVTYDGVTFGQRRVLLVWHRLILPGGRV